MNPYQVVKDFERAVGEYTGAPYVVAVNSCTAALLLAVAWHLKNQVKIEGGLEWVEFQRTPIEIPKRTYVSVPMSIIHAGGRPTFRDEVWRGCYQLKPIPVWDCARWFTYDLWRAVQIPGGRRWFSHDAMVCVSFHASKTLGDTQGGAILLSDQAAAAWLRRARFDGRTERIPPNMDKFYMVGWHCYMSADVAARLLLKLHSLPKHNDPLANDDYPDLSEMEIFNGRL